MLFNISYSSKKTEGEINALMGDPFSFIQRIKMGGVGTSKLQIVEASQNIADLIQDRSASYYCYLELRPKGLMVGFQSHLRSFVLCIPFYELSIYYNGGLLSIYGKSGSFKLEAPFNSRVDKKYLSKVLSMKAEFLSGQNFNA